MARVAIVTGGTRGIGKAICDRLKRQGHTVIANYGGNDEAARAFSKETGIPVAKWDVGDHQACLDGCAEIAAEHGPIDIVINNAGITRDATLHRMSFDDWNDVQPLTERQKQLIALARSAIGLLGRHRRGPASARVNRATSMLRSFAMSSPH